MSSSGYPSGAVAVANVRFFLAGKDRFDRHVPCIRDCLGQRDSSGGFLTLGGKSGIGSKKKCNWLEAVTASLRPAIV